MRSKRSDSQYATDAGNRPGLGPGTCTACGNEIDNEALGAPDGSEVSGVHQNCVRYGRDQGRRGFILQRVLQMHPVQ